MRNRPTGGRHTGQGCSRQNLCYLTCHQRLCYTVCSLISLLEISIRKLKSNRAMQKSESIYALQEVITESNKQLAALIERELSMVKDNIDNSGKLRDKIVAARESAVQWQTKFEDSEARFETSTQHNRSLKKELDSLNEK